MRMYSFLMALIVIIFISVSGMAAIVTFGPTQPTIGTEDISCLAGAATDMDNVGTATMDGNTNDATTYISYDRTAQGQTFVTPSLYPAY